MHSASLDGLSFVVKSSHAVMTEMTSDGRRREKTAISRETVEPIGYDDTQPASKRFCATCKLHAPTWDVRTRSVAISMYRMNLRLVEIMITWRYSLFPLHDCRQRRVGWWSAAFLLYFAAAASAQSRRPNIVFIFSDDHALQAIGAYGSRINETPNIDRIAREGTVFVNSFCANSLCGPSRACIQTGKHSHVNGFLRNGNRFDSSQVTFPKLLQQAGYETAVIGKWHLESDPVGFNYWEVLPGQGNYYNPDLLEMDGSRKRYEGYCTDIITELSLRWLQQQRDTSKPFLLMCQHKAPHRNWAPAARHFDLYRNQDIREPETLFDDYAGRTPLLRENEMSIQRHFHWGHDMKFHGLNLFPSDFADQHKNDEYDRMTAEQKLAWDGHYEPENRAFIENMRAGRYSDHDVVHWKYERYIKDYLRCVAAVDESVGRILEYLDQSGLAENTIVIYASDQGFYLGEHGW
jgi:arylsulfatase A-like enzyme